VAEIHVGTAFINILPDTDKFVTQLSAQMKGVSAAVNKSGDQALLSSGKFEILGDAIKGTGDVAALAAAAQSAVGNAAEDAGASAVQATMGWGIYDGVIKDTTTDAAQSSLNFEALSGAIDDVGGQAIQTSFDFSALSASIAVTDQEAEGLNRTLAASALLRGGGIFGGPPGKGIATDVGSFFRGISNIAQGALSFLLLIAPTINIIIAALVGMVSLLTAAVVGAVAFAAALTATAAVMGLAAFKWRNLLTETKEGAETFQGAFLAIQAEAFNMARGVVKSFSDMGSSGKDLWTSIGEAGVRGLRAMQPAIDWVVEHVQNFIDALNGVGGASSPFLEFIRTWLNEWKVLGGIINQGVEGGGGLLGFFEKYEEPAKAFVEGIAQVINGIRKMSAMGLGLNMDQLAELIRNVFTWLQQIVQVFPKFSNALVSVGLELSRFLLAILPITTAAIELGAAILQNIVAPLLNGFLVAVQAVMNAPFIHYIFELAGAMGILALAISTLSFKQLKFVAIIKFMGVQLLWLANVAGAAVLKFLPAMSAAMFSTMAPFVGAAVIIAVVGAAFLLLKGTFAEVGAAAKATAETFDSSMESLKAGAMSTAEVLSATYKTAQEGFNNLSNIGKVVYGVQHFGDAVSIILTSATVSTTLARDAVDQLSEAWVEMGDDLSSGILSGGWTDEQVKVLEQAREDLLASREMTAQGPLNTDEQVAAFDALKAGGDVWLKELSDLYTAYEDGTINTGQYVTMLGQLYGSEKAAGEVVNLTALKIQAASDMIVQALLEVQQVSETGTAQLEEYAKGSGQAFLDLRDKMYEAVNDPVGGLLGTGDKITEFFKEQAGVIEQWKADTAEAFNFVKDAFAGLADGSAVSFSEIRSTLQNAVQDLLDYTKNWKELRTLGASQELLRQVKDLGQGGAEVLKGLIQGGREGVRQVNRLVASGVTLSEALAVNMADALGVTLDKLIVAFEVLASSILGISFDRVAALVERKMDKATRPRTVNITTNYKETGKATGFAPGPGGSPSFSATLPSKEAMLKAARAVGNAVQSGFAEGIKFGSGAKTAAIAMANESIQGAANAVGMGSPARKFIEIGKSTVDGLIAGVSQGTGRLVAQMTQAGTSMANGLRSGLMGGLDSIKIDAVNKVQELVDAVNTVLRNASPSKVFYEIGQNIAEGLRLGIGDGMGRVHSDMIGHTRGLQTTFDGLDSGRAGISQMQYASQGRSSPSDINGEMRILDWRTGIASLDGELAWEDAVRTR